MIKIEDVFKENRKPYVIAEISQNHDGSLGQAHAYIDAVADCGVDAVKFQTHIAEEESTINEPFRVKFSYEDSTRYDYWKRMEFTEEQWGGLYTHALDRGIEFLSSPFSDKALELLDRIGVRAWKLGAGEVFNNRLLIKAAETKKPLILSTGLSTYSDIDKQLGIIRERGCDVALLQCVTAYPSSPEIIDINHMIELNKRYNCKVGISDHSATIYPSLAASTLGASFIEVHVTMSHSMFGPDVKASVNLTQLRQIVEGVSFIHMMLNNRFDHSMLSEKQVELRRMFSKSMYAAAPLKKGDIVRAELFKAKKPCCGVEMAEFDQLVGKKLIRSLSEGDPLNREDIED